jgi:hypothetical protein
MDFCIYSSRDCIECKENGVCKKRVSTKKDLKHHFSASLMLGINEKIKVIFATKKENPDGESYCLLRKHFFTFWKPTILINPQLLMPEMVAYLHMKE